MHYTIDKLRDAGYKYENNNTINLREVLKFLDPNNSRSFDNWDMDEKYGINGMVDKGDYYEGCICGHDIRYEFRAVHKTTGDSIDIGSHCISYFSTKMKKKVDGIKRRYANPNAKYCFKCKRKVTDSMVEQINKKLPKPISKTQKYCHEICWTKHKKHIYNTEKLKCERCKKMIQRCDLSSHTYNKHKYAIKLHSAKNRVVYFGPYLWDTLIEISRKHIEYVKWLSDNRYKIDYRDDALFLIKYFKLIKTKNKKILLK